MFSMAGIPPLAGFFGKLYVFMAAIEAELYTLAVIGVLTSVVGAFYYLRIVKLMYFDEPAEAFDRPIGREMALILTGTGLAILLFFVVPGPDRRRAAAAAAPPCSRDEEAGAAGTTGERPRCRRLSPGRARQSVDSTNDEARAWPREGAEDGTLVWAGTDQGPGPARPRLGQPARQSLPVAGAAARLLPGRGGAARLRRRAWPRRCHRRGRAADDRGDLQMAERRAVQRPQGRRHPARIAQLAPDGGLDWLVLGIGVNVASFPADTEFPATACASRAPAPC